MDNKTHHSSGDSTTSSSSNSNNNRDQYLKHLNKISHKISKPITRKPSSDHHHNPPPPPSTADQNQNQNQNQSLPQHSLQQHQNQHQPPVYNINKSDFRDVVQRLTGSPAHESRLSTPPPIQPPKPPSSRLQRIRPPPLAQISNRPPPLLKYAAHPPPPFSGQRGPHAHPLSPLPPFPSVHAAAESPISAYMRYIAQSQSMPPPQPENIPPHPPPPAAQPQFGMPSSPLPFGCFPSPRSPYPLLSPNLLFSPTTMGQLGFQQFPISPRLPMPSPGWKDL